MDSVNDEAGVSNAIKILEYDLNKENYLQWKIFV